MYIYFLSVFTSKTTSSETFDVNDGTTLSSKICVIQMNSMSQFLKKKFNLIRQKISLPMGLTIRQNFRIFQATSGAGCMVPGTSG